MQIQSFDVSDFNPKTAKIEIQRLELREGHFCLYGTLFSTEEIVSMPALPAACGYSRLKSCDYARKTSEWGKKLLHLII